jgi:hypothetical protein
MMASYCFFGNILFLKYVLAAWKNKVLQPAGVIPVFIKLKPWFEGRGTGTIKAEEVLFAIKE